jgi:transcription antitermination factor NusG
MKQPYNSPLAAEMRVRPGNGSYPWFALRVRSRYENTVATILGGKGYEWFLPLYKSRRAWSDRIKEIQLPLFPGYIFCRFDLQHRLPILTTPGVVTVVGISKCPIPIDDAEIAAIQATVRSGLQSRPWPFLQIGQKVRVEYGPLCGLEGILLDFKGQRRLVLSVTLLQRSVAVEVDGAWVVPIPQQRQACAATLNSSHLSSQLTA